MKNTLLTLALFSAFNVNAATNLIQNGSFEDYAVMPGTFNHIATDITVSGDCVPSSNCLAKDSTWQAFAGSPNQFLEVRDSYFGVAQNGSQFAELTPSALSGITQSFMASAGLGILSWYDIGRSSSNYSYEVVLNNDVIYSGRTSLSSMWTQKVYEVNLLSDNILSFRSTALITPGSTLGANIDNISVIQTSVSAVPEAETYAMFLAGLGLLAFTSRRRQS